MKNEKSMTFPLKKSCKIEANNVSICKMHSVHEGIKKAFYFRAFLFVFCSDKTIAFEYSCSGTGVKTTY